MPSTRPANIHASPSRRRSNIRPNWGIHSYTVRGTAPSITAGVYQARIARPSRGAAAAIHAVTERGTVRSTATDSASTKGKANSTSSIGLRSARGGGWGKGLARRRRRIRAGRPGLPDRTGQGIAAPVCAASDRRPPLCFRDDPGSRKRGVRLHPPSRAGSTVSTRTALVFGGSGQIGRALLARLVELGWGCTAISRQRREDLPGALWVAGNLDPAAAPRGLPASFDAIFSCGPLDLFSHWYADSRVGCGRVLAFG